MKKFLIAIILWCSVAIQAAEKGTEKAENKKEKRQRAQSAGPLPVPMAVSPSGGLSPAAASPGSVHPNIGASASPTSPVLLGVVEQAIKAEEAEIERVREKNKPYKPFSLFDRKKSPVVAPGRPASVGAIPQRSASAGNENSYSKMDAVEEFLNLFSFKKALFRKEVIQKSPTNEELDRLAESLSLDLYRGYLESLNSKLLDLQGSIRDLNKQLFTSDAFKNANKEKQDALAYTFRILTDKLEKKLREFSVMSPHQLQLAENRVRAFSESPPGGGGQFSPPIIIPGVFVDEEFRPIEDYSEEESDQLTHQSPAAFFQAGRSVTPRPDTTLTGREYKEYSLPSGRAARGVFVLPEFPEETDYEVARDKILPANNDDYQGEEDEPDLADFMRLSEQEKASRGKVPDEETEI